MREIWIVDDDKVFHYVFKRYLRELGVSSPVREFTNASEFLEACARNGAIPAIVLLDLNMPGVDGWKVLDQLQTQGSKPWSAPIFIITSSIDPADVTRARACPLVKQVLTKPIALQTFAKALAEIKLN
ncbi:MAG: response regulator [Bradyrhizobiaceae bacterium]|nr:response regulator [Bradyrhizobiaceae bacterium]